jgi:hypothetical protein
VARWRSITSPPLALMNLSEPGGGRQQGGRAGRVHIESDDAGVYAPGWASPRSPRGPLDCDWPTPLTVNSYFAKYESPVDNCALAMSISWHKFARGFSRWGRLETQASLLVAPHCVAGPGAVGEWAALMAEHWKLKQGAPARLRASC